MGTGWRNIACLSLVVVASGCEDALAPNARVRAYGGEAAIVPPIAEQRMPEREHFALAAEFPGYGGYYFDENGNMPVPVVALAHADALTARLSPKLHARGRGASVNPAPNPIVIVEAALYSFPQRAAWRETIGGLVFSLPGGVMVGIDMKLNKVVAGVKTMADVQLLSEAMNAAGIPPGAVDVRAGYFTRPVATLWDRLDPLEGSLAIRGQNSSTGVFLGECTLGFNANTFSMRGFVTASHCTTARGGANNTTCHQPAMDVGRRVIGDELNDPEWLEYLSYYQCPGPANMQRYSATRWRCRYADAAFIQYLPNVGGEIGQSWRTTSYGEAMNVGSVEITTTEYPHWFYWSEVGGPSQGDLIYKTGMDTGWTRGTVDLECSDWRSGETDFLLLCQFHVAGALAGPGDSGGLAALHLMGPGPDAMDGTLAGLTALASPTGFAGSRMEYIKSELGAAYGSIVVKQ